MDVVDIGTAFYHRLANRDENQGDGRHTAVMFRQKYLSVFDKQETWNEGKVSIILDFRNVKKIGPSFANEAFAYFTKYAKPTDILKQIKLTETSRVQLAIVMQELETGYKRI